MFVYDSSRQKTALLTYCAGSYGVCEGPASVPARESALERCDTPSVAGVSIFGGGT